MKQILHIFAKDFRHFWPEILISLALLGALVWIYPSTWLLETPFMPSLEEPFCQLCWERARRASDAAHPPELVAAHRSRDSCRSPGWRPPVLGHAAL